MKFYLFWHTYSQLPIHLHTQLYMAKVSLDYKLSTSRIRNDVMQQYVWFTKAPWLMWLNFVLALVRLGYPQQNKHI